MTGAATQADGLSSRQDGVDQRKAGRSSWLSHRRMQLQSAGPLIILLALVVIFSVANDQFLRVGNVKAILESASIALVLSTAVTFVVLMGSIDLSVEGVMATASITLSLLVANSFTTLSLGPLGIVACVLIGLAFGLVNGLLVVRSKIQSLIVTLGTWFIGLGLAATLYPARQPVISDPVMVFLGLNRSLGVSPLVIVAVAVLAAAVVIERQTKFGRIVFGIGSDERLMAFSGVHVGLYKVGAFALAGALVGVAAVMVTAQLGVGNATAGQGYLFSTITAVVVGGTLLSGGRGGVLHSAVGVMILEVLRNGMVLMGVNPFSQRMIEGLGIVAAVVIGNWHLRRRLRVIK